MLCPDVYIKVCSAVLYNLIFNSDLSQLFHKCCLGTKWVSESQVCISRVQRTPTSDVFRLWTLRSHCHTCCPFSRVMWECHTKPATPKWCLQLTTFHVHRCARASLLLLDTHTQGTSQLSRDWKQFPWQLGYRFKVCFSAPGANGQGRHL